MAAFALAWIVATLFRVTALVATWNWATVAPPLKLTDAGTVANALSLARATDIPFEGAGELRVKVAVEGVPPVTVVGLRVSDLGTMTKIVRFAETFVDWRVAVMVACVDPVAANVVTTNDAVREPPGTVMEAGTLAKLLLLATVAVIPPAGAGPVKVSVAVESVPPNTLAGLTDND
jgi:hypothetical protein